MLQRLAPIRRVLRNKPFFAVVSTSCCVSGVPSGRMDQNRVDGGVVVVGSNNNNKKEEGEEPQQKKQERNSNEKVTAVDYNDKTTAVPVASAAAVVPNNTNRHRSNDGLERRTTKKTATKRGIITKPQQRPRRNRKRARSNINSNNDNLVVNASVCRLELDGKPLRLVDGTEYIRLVEPYPYTFATYAKARWLGRTVLDVYHEEFGSYPKSYYEGAIAQGRILVSDQKVDPSYQIKGGDVLAHTVHRHEPAVAVHSDRPPFVRIIEESDDLLVVDKPGTMPVHACGGYHNNSLMNILEPQFGVGENKKLYTIHRLDRLTSGLLLLAKSSEVAQKWGKCILQRDHCEKLYLARVKGRFPLNASTQNNNTEDLKTILPNRHSSSDIHDQLQQPLPRYGEWIVEPAPPSSNGLTEQQQHIPKAATDGGAKKGKESTEAETAAAYATAKRKNVFGHWMTDFSGRLQEDMTLAEYANKQNNDLEGLLEQLGRCRSSGNDTTETTTTTTTKSTTSRSAAAPSSASTTAGETTNSQNNSNPYHNNNNNNNDDDVFWLHFACPTRVAKPKDGVCECGPFEELDPSTYVKTVKPSQTSFAIISYDPQTDSTLVLCRPHTGRTHQIRLHLQHLGHPIANDPNYGGDLWYCDEEGRDACRVSQQRLDKAKTTAENNNDNNNSNNENTSKSNNNTIVETGITTDVPASKEEIRCLMSSKQDRESINDFIQRTCVWCARGRGLGNKKEHGMLEFLVRSHGIWLHALQYTITTEEEEEDNDDGRKQTTTKSETFRAGFPSWTFLAPTTKTTK